MVTEYNFGRKWFSSREWTTPERLIYTTPLWYYGRKFYGMVEDEDGREVPEFSGGLDIVGYRHRRTVIVGALLLTPY